MKATAADILWEPSALSTNNESAVLPNATARSFAMDVALPDASRIARGLQNGDTEIYDTSTGARIHTIPSNGTYVSQIEASPDGKTLAVGTGAARVRVFDANSYAEIGGFAIPAFVYSIAFRGNEIFASTWDGGPVTVYNMQTRAVRTILGGANQTDYITSIDDRLYGYDTRGVLKEVDPVTGQLLRSTNVAGGSRIDASSESGIIAMGTAGGNVIIFDEDLRQLGAFHPGMGAIQHVGFDASGTRLTARSDAGGIVFIDLSTVRAGGMMTEAGRAPAGDSAAYEVGMPMTPDGTVVFVHEANSVTARKTPWEPLPPPEPEEDGSEPQEGGVPSEVTDLIEETVRLARNGLAWRTPEAGEIIANSSAKATRLQFTPRQGEAVAITANIFPKTSVTAYVYKGTEKIWSGPVPSDGVFTHENAEGITDVLFTSGSTVFASNVSIVTDEAVDVPAYALTPMNSAEFAVFAARPISQPANMAAAAQRLDIRGAISGTGSSESRVLLNRDQNQYTLLRMNVSSGNSRIFDVKAIRLKGLDYRQREEVEFVGLQDGFVERIDDRTWIVAPGMPAALVATLGFYQRSTYSIQVVNGLSREAVMPLLTMGRNTVDIDLLTMNDQFRTEGVFPGVTEARQSEWPVFAKAGHSLNATYNIKNEALNGGAVILDVYVGWHTGEPTRGTLQETFNFPLGGGETKMISVNVTAPPRPANATSDRPIIHTVARLPNGESAIHTRLGKALKGETRVITNREGGGLNISYVSREYTAAEQERIRYLTDRALTALLDSPDERLVAIRDTLGDDHIVQLLAESSAAAVAAAGAKTDAQEAAASEEGQRVLLAMAGTDYVNLTGLPAMHNASLGPVSPPIPYETIWGTESKIKTEDLNVSRYAPAEITFKLAERKMVNFGINGNDIHAVPGIAGQYTYLSGSPVAFTGNVRLLLTGKTSEGYDVKWETDKKPGSGETMSGMLEPGTYSLKAYDTTDYSVPSLVVPGEKTVDITNGLSKVPLSVSIIPYNSANIVGNVSVEGSSKTMPVSLRVAKFNEAGERNLDYSNITKLDPTKPVWVISHGRVNNEDSSQIMELARNLSNLGVQVVTLDWHDGAKDNDIPLVGLEGSKWIEATGTWAANQLKSLKFIGENINVVGHSWGSYVSYEIGAHIPDGVKTLVALDPAADTPAFGGGKYKGFSDPDFKFSNVASNSYAFHSSDLSNAKYALSAEYAFDVVAPEGYEAGGIYDDRSEFLAWLYETEIERPITDAVTDAMREHSFAIDVFSGLLARQKMNPMPSTASLFSLENLRSTEDEFQKGGSWEGVFYVDPMRFENTIGTEAGNTVWKAKNFGFVSRDKYGNAIVNPRQL